MLEGTDTVDNASIINLAATLLPLLPPSNIDLFASYCSHLWQLTFPPGELLPLRRWFLYHTRRMSSNTRWAIEDLRFNSNHEFITIDTIKDDNKTTYEDLVEQQLGPLEHFDGKLWSKIIYYIRTHCNCDAIDYRYHVHPFMI